MFEANSELKWKLSGNPSVLKSLKNNEPNIAVVAYGGGTAGDRGATVIRALMEAGLWDNFGILLGQSAGQGNIYHAEGNKIREAGEQYERNLWNGLFTFRRTFPFLGMDYQILEQNGRDIVGVDQELVRERALTKTHVLTVASKKTLMPEVFYMQNLTGLDGVSDMVSGVMASTYHPLLALDAPYKINGQEYIDPMYAGINQIRQAAELGATKIFAIASLPITEMQALRHSFLKFVQFIRPDQEATMFEALKVLHQKVNEEVKYLNGDLIIPGVDVQVYQPETDYISFTTGVLVDRNNGLKKLQKAKLLDLELAKLNLQL